MNDTYMAIPRNNGAQMKQTRGGISPVSLIFAIIFGVGFGIIAFSVVTGQGWLEQIDNTIESFVISLRADALSPVFRTLSLLGSVKVMGVIIVVFLVFLLIKKQFKAVLFFILAFGIPFAVCFAVKFGVGRPRPTAFLLDAELVETEPCFPSGHAWNAVMAFGLIYVIIRTYVCNLGRHKGVSVIFLILAILLPLLIGFSRLYMGEHYPTDVIAGLLGGSFFVLILGSVYMRRTILIDSPLAAGWDDDGRPRDINPWASFEAVNSDDPDITRIQPMKPAGTKPPATKKSSSSSKNYVGRHTK